MDIDQFDAQDIYCRKLGHPLSFGYCRIEHAGLPCPRLMACWEALVPVQAWLGEHFASADIAYMSEPPPPKLSTLLELIKKAQSQK